MSTRTSNGAAIEHDDFVGMGEECDLVRNNDHCTGSRYFSYGVCHELFRVPVEMCGHLIQKKDFRFLQ